MGTSLEERLRRHYASTADAVDEAQREHVVRLVAAEAARAAEAPSAPGVPLWRFALGQMRFVSPAAWALQLALLGALLCVAGAFGFSEDAMPIVMSAAVLSVAIAVPPVFKSFDFHVDELEYACRHNCMQVLCSRLLLFGLADVLWLSAVVALAPSFAGSDPFRIFLYACTPYFASCAAVFHVARLRRRGVALACVVAALAIVAAIWGAGIAFPRWYADVSVLAWTAALACAVALAAYEARRLVVQVASGMGSPAADAPA